MTDDASLVEGAVFALFAESQFDVWGRVVSATVKHLQYGVGTIVKVLPRQKHPPLIHVQFAHGISIFNPDGFKSGVILFVCIPDSLAGDFAKWKAEEPARIAAQAFEEEERRRSAEERRRLVVERQRAADQQQREAEEHQRAAEEQKRAAELADKPWRNWIQEVHRQIVGLSSFATEVARRLKALTDQDQKLCLAWANRSFGATKPISEQWREFVNSDRNEALRMWSARSAEKVAISFFAGCGKRTIDVSVHQLDNISDEWKTHDIEIDGEPVDVKNARTSFSSPSSYAEHTIPTFKKVRGSTLGVNILGVLSEYVTWQRIEEEDFGSATILGVVCKEDLVALGSWMNKNFGDILDFSLLGDARLETYPGWLFEYPADWHTKRPEALKQIGMLLRQCPDPRRAKDTIPHYILGFFDESFSALTKLRTPLEHEVIGKLLTLRREIGLSRRTLFAWILGTMLRTLIDRGGTAVQETAAALRRLLYVPDVDWASQYPAGLYDPLAYLESLIAMFEAIAQRVHPDLLLSMTFFRLASPTILRGRLDDGVTWQTVYAHCGGRRTYGPRGSTHSAPCGKNPIHLGNAKICPECHFLICGDCGFCMDSCPLCKVRQR